MKEIKVKVNGKDIPLTEFPKKFIIKLVLPMLDFP